MLFFFLYKEVLKQDLDLKVDAVRAKKCKYLSTVLIKDEGLAIIEKLSAIHQLLIKLLYGTRLRIVPIGVLLTLMADPTSWGGKRSLHYVVIYHLLFFTKQSILEKVRRKA
ncbi:putative transposase (plasmid) [Nostoc carneum NIES-2107]|nr:putative transposase [Nostoc carneum NIES-2107]